MQQHITRKMFFVTLGVALLFQSGCAKDDGRPKDFPKVHPVSITITQEGQPLEGASVVLESATKSKYSSSGTTDVSGVATIKTYSYLGAPVGDYTVLVKKSVPENQVEMKTPEGDTYLAGGDYYNYVAPKYSEKESAFKITVTDKGGKETFEVGAPVRVFLYKVSTN